MFMEIFQKTGFCLVKKAKISLPTLMFIFIIIHLAKLGFE